jgi:regulator of RNase E activity RraB
MRLSRSSLSLALREDHPFGVSIIRTQPVEQRLIDATVIELLRLAKRLEGEHEGWETPAITQ